MYFYTLSNGEYSDYSYTKIYHENKFTNLEFVEMYNKAILAAGKECYYHDEVAEKLVELFGFKIIEDQFEIRVGYGAHEPINLNEISEDFTCFYRD